MTDMAHLIATLQAFDQQFDSLTLKKAHDESDAICGIHQGTFSKASRTLGYYDIKTKNYVDTPAAQQFKKAFEYFVRRVAQRITNEFALYEHQGKIFIVISEMARTNSSIEGLMRDVHKEIPKTIALLQAVK